MTMLDETKLFIDKLKPLPEYPGRKGSSGTFQKILSEIPRCEIFIDAMCGSGFISSLISGCRIVVNDYDQSVIDRLNHAQPGISFENKDYQYIIDKYDDGRPGTVFYFDPPYMMETRSYKGKLYKYDWSLKDHNRFLKAVQKIKSNVMISHYKCGRYDKDLKDWRTITYKSNSRAGVRDESLYMNFDQPALLHCFDHVGENFTDRQRIKRKVERLTRRLIDEAEKERAAILSAIIKEFTYIR